MYISSPLNRKRSNFAGILLKGRNPWKKEIRDGRMDVNRGRRSSRPLMRRGCCIKIRTEIEWPAGWHIPTWKKHLVPSREAYLGSSGLTLPSSRGSNILHLGHELDADLPKLW